MPQVTVETLKAQTTECVDRASTGERLVVTDQDRPVAVLSGLEDDPEIRQGWKLVRDGVATWSGGKLQPPVNPPKIKGRPTSDLVIENRR
jgi:prevent-host-death family protein